MTVKEYLKVCAFELENAIKDNLGKDQYVDGKLYKNRGIGITGNLRRLIRVDPTASGFHISIPMYGKYLEYGMPNPTSPEELEEWVRTKILKTTGRGKKTERTIKKISENMANHITLFGPRPFPFFRPAMYNDLPKILQKNRFLLEND